MKKTAKKALSHSFSVRGRSVPTLAIALVFLIGGGSAAIFSGIIDLSTTLSEPTTVDTSSASLDIQYPGESDTVTYRITNNADTSYGFLVNSSSDNASVFTVESVSAGSGVSVVESEPATSNDFNNDGDKLDLKLNVGPAASDTPVTVEISTDHSAEAGQISINGDVVREAAFSN